MQTKYHTYTNAELIRIALDHSDSDLAEELAKRLEEHLPKILPARSYPKPQRRESK